MFQLKFLILILTLSLSIAAILANTPIPISNTPPIVKLIQAQFHTRHNLANPISSFNSEKHYLRYILPITFQSLTFSCESPYPTNWKFEFPPHNYPTLKDFHIIKRRDVPIESFWNNSTYKYSSNLTLNFKKPFSVPSIFCTRTKTAGGNLTTRIESFPTRDTFHIEVRITRESKGIPEYEEKRFGENKNCSVKLQMHTETKTFKCGPNSRPQIIQCNNQDECNSIFVLDDLGSGRHCVENTTFSQKPCTSSDCVRLLPSYSPAVIICQDEANNSIARRYFMYPEYLHNCSKEPEPIMRLGRDESDFISETVRLMVNSTTVYVHQSATFTCMGTGAFYSFGFKWGIQIGNNNNSLVIQDGENASESFNTTIHSYQAKIDINFSKDWLSNNSQVTVYCFAPRSNRDDWVNASMLLEVMNPEVPKIIVTEETVSDSPSNISKNGESYWHSFSCIATGKPRVRISWMWNNYTLNKNVSENSGNLYKIETEDQSDLVGEEATKSTLEVRFSRNDDHTFVCKATNFYASASHTFEVERVNSKTIIIIGSSVSIVVILVISVVAFLITRHHYRMKLQLLSDEEIEEFENGNFNSDTRAFIFPYSMDNEIPQNEITILDNSVLGEGQFGIVYKGLYKSRTVAVKSLKKTAEARMLKALLAEIKILCFVGKHENLVNLVGAVTRNMRQREVFLITEFCENGNLLKFLKQSRGMCLDLFKTNKGANECRKELRLINVKNSTVNVLPCITTLHLVNWSYDIACGMEFLASKNVIHGDLATRNVLLTDGLVAKVSDFGLSKQVEDYAIYVQETKCPLPLKWLAIESLQDFEFSIQSDVWTYGICLWEIFSLGAVPYPGIEWNHESYSLLLKGYRMENPPLSNDGIYNIMKACWDASPKARPSFTNLKEFFQELMESLKKMY